MRIDAPDSGGSGSDDTRESTRSVERETMERAAGSGSGGDASDGSGSDDARESTRSIEREAMERTAGSGSGGDDSSGSGSDDARESTRSVERETMESEPDFGYGALHGLESDPEQVNQYDERTQQTIQDVEQQAIDAGLREDEFAIRLTDDQVAVDVAEPRLERRQRLEFQEDVAEEWGVDTDDVIVGTEGDEFRAELSGSAQRELLREQAADEFGVDPDEIEIEYEDGEMRAVAEESGGGGIDLDLETIGTAPFQAQQAAWGAAASAVEDPVDTAKSVGTAPFRAQQAVWSSAADGVEDADSQTVAAGAAITAIPEPTPVTETVGLGIIGGAMVGSAAARQLEKGNEAEVTEINQAEIEMPEEREAFTTTEIETPATYEAVSSAEVDTPETRGTIAVDEFGVPETPEAISPEVEVPQETFDTPDSDAPTIEAEQIAIGRGRRVIDEADDEFLITPDELVDPDELRQQELDELRRQVEEQAEYARSSPEDVLDQEPFLFPGEPETTVAQDLAERQEFTDITDTAVRQETSVQQPLPASGFDDVTPTLRAHETALQSALATPATTPELAEPTAAELALDYPAQNLTAQGPGSSRRRLRWDLESDIDDLDPAGDLDASMGDEQVEFYVPDPDDIGLSMEDIDDIQP